MLASALLRMICSMLLLLHMPPFTLRYSPASTLVVMLLLSSRDCSCRTVSKGQVGGKSGQSTWWVGKEVSQSTGWVGGGGGSEHRVGRGRGESENGVGQSTGEGGES